MNMVRYQLTIDSRTRAELLKALTEQHERLTQELKTSEAIAQVIFSAPELPAESNPNAEE